MNKEDQLIARIQKRLSLRGGGTDRDAGLSLGSGDDACVLRATPGREWVASADAFLENVHFVRRLHPPASIGYKALARATSDLAAMGAKPRSYLLSLALPTRLPKRWLDGFLAGMARAARKFGMGLAGGDTSRAPAIAINLTVQLGLEIILRRLSGQANLRRYLVPHLHPDPPIALAQWLSRRELPSSMMDLSDGLSTDLDRLCRSSGVGASVREASLPLIRVPDSLVHRGFSIPNLALHGGEDYQLLFTVPARAASRIPPTRDGVRITEIGEIVRGRDVLLISADGKSAPLTPRGWDHFSRTRARPK
jgi:thiamine-monophosphate kinase